MYYRSCAPGSHHFGCLQCGRRTPAAGNPELSGAPGTGRGGHRRQPWDWSSPPSPSTCACCGTWAWSDMRRDGRNIYYRTNAEAIRPLHEWTSTFERYWRHQLNRVKERAERKRTRRTAARKSSEGVSMNLTEPSIENLTLNITEEIHVRASLEATFAALLEEMGPHNEAAEGQPMPMKIEPWPGGRWYRDLGDGDGHFWGHVQAIKRPVAARNHRSAVHVLSGRLERAVPPQRGGRRDPDPVPARGPGTDTGRPQEGVWRRAGAASMPGPARGPRRSDHGKGDKR